MIDDVTDQDATRSLIHDFSTDVPNAEIIYNDVEGDSSNDSDDWAWMAAHYDGVTFIVDAFIHYQVSTDTVDLLIPADLTGTNLDHRAGDASFPRPNMVEISPLGSGIILHYGRAFLVDTSSNRPEDIGTWFDGPHTWPLNFNWAQSTPVKISIDETHSGWSFDANGMELFISQNNRTDWLDAINLLGPTAGYDNRVEVASHGDFGYSNGFHYGKMPPNRPGWIFVNTYSNVNNPSHPDDWAADQLFMIAIKPYTENPVVWRIGPNYNRYDGFYRDEAPAALNLTGNRIYVTTNWGGDLDHREVFLFELPEDWNTSPSLNP